jgi:hypothetical protein
VVVSRQRFQSWQEAARRHVIAIKSYHQMINFIESAAEVKQNTMIIAQQAKLAISSAASVKATQAKATVFKQPDVKPLVAKYKLPDDLQASLEKGLRVAATNNQAEDLKVFISVVKNINAQDANPKVMRTALHWAAVKGQDECYQLLIAAGAKSDIHDYEGKTAEQY